MRNIIGRQVQVQHLRHVGIVEQHIQVEQQHQIVQSEQDIYIYVHTIRHEIHDDGCEHINWIKQRQLYE